MGKLIYIANTSLDGYMEDRDGGIEWGTPDEEYFSSINGLERPIGAGPLWTRMYEAMLYWETAPIADQPAWVLTSPISGGPPTRSCSRRPWQRSQGEDHSGTGVRRRDDSADEGRRGYPPTSLWLELISLPNVRAGSS